MAPSSRNLILANALTLTLALIFDWEASWLMWTYWVQSLVVGWYARKRMLALTRFSTEGFTSNGQRVPEDESGKRSTANFFAIHYGFFHLAYLVFLASQHRVDGWRDLLILLACGVSFVYSQRATYAAQHASDLRGKPNLGALMFTPYLRILPMHLAIIFGGGAAGGPALLIFFTALKTASDIGLDAIDRRMAAKSAEKSAVPTVVE
ncbi:MAG: hypothetical protein E6Q50_03345 [Lysobacter sp.]|nr:MAG: hypothetical protein E6Q50_03345 [Lysobacter sp.]